jgi:hypothetical protein
MVFAQTTSLLESLKNGSLANNLVLRVTLPRNHSALAYFVAIYHWAGGFHPATLCGLENRSIALVFSIHPKSAMGLLCCMDNYLVSSF